MNLTKVPVKPADKVKVRGRKARRVQRSRKKGQRLPKTAIYVGRGSPYGNGWKVGDLDPDTNEPMTRADVIDRHRTMLAGASAETIARLRGLLGGYDLACWCPLDKACHADLLLAVANATTGEAVWDALHPEQPAAEVLAAFDELTADEADEALQRARDERDDEPTDDELADEDPEDMP